VNVDLRNRVVLITGGAGGIGTALCASFAANGAHVAVASRKPETEQFAVECDVRDFAQCQAAVARTVEKFGRLDVLVHNHGANFLAPAAGISPNGWRAITSVVLDGTFHMSRAAFEPLRASGRGRIISIAATNAVSGSPLMAPSGAGKAGVLSLMQSLAGEGGPFGVTWNCGSPGPGGTRGRK